MKMNRWVGSFLLGGIFFFPATGQAHLRNFLDTYGYDTLSKGKLELELWTDLNDPDHGDRYWQNQTEVEYGVTDHYSLGFYGVFVDGQGFTALKIENRYRFAEKGQWPIDTAVYLEFKDANGSKDEDEVEGKLILSKDIGKLNIVANPILSYEREREASGEIEWESKTALALGVAYKIPGRVTPGVELFLAEGKSRITPGIYVDILPEVRFNFGVGLGLESKADDAQLKTILEIEF